MTNIKSDAHRLSEDTKVPKELTNIFSSKLIVSELVNITSETPSNAAPIFNATK